MDNITRAERLVDVTQMELEDDEDCSGGISQPSHNHLQCKRYKNSKLKYRWKEISVQTGGPVVEDMDCMTRMADKIDVDGCMMTMIVEDLSQTLVEDDDVM